MLFKTLYNLLGELGILKTIMETVSYKCMVALEDPLLVAILTT